MPIQENHTPDHLPDHHLRIDQLRRDPLRTRDLPDPVQNLLVEGAPRNHPLSRLLRSTMERLRIADRNRHVPLNLDRGRDRNRGRSRGQNRDQSRDQSRGQSQDQSQDQNQDQSQGRDREVRRWRNLGKVLMQLPVKIRDLDPGPGPGPNPDPSPDPDLDQDRLQSNIVTHRLDLLLVLSALNRVLDPVLAQVLVHRSRLLDLDLHLDREHLLRLDHAPVRRVLTENRTAGLDRPLSIKKARDLHHGPRLRLLHELKLLDLVHDHHLHR